METSLKKAYFASRQVRAGPAPLASFEDLPSDELESPEEFNETLTLSFGSNHDDESSSQEVQLMTPETLTISSESTPRIECDVGSSFTTTPDDSYKGQATSELRTTSLSSLSKDSVVSIRQKKGSAQSLGTNESTDKNQSQRKSSWTDIFRSHNHNSAKLKLTVISNQENLDKTLKKKNKEVIKKEASETKSKEKNKFLSLFKKKEKNVCTPLSPSELTVANENINLPECLNYLEEEVIMPTNTKVSNGNIFKGKENEIPIEILVITVNEEQNDLGKKNNERCNNVSNEDSINHKLINIIEQPLDKEYNILSIQPEKAKTDPLIKSNILPTLEDEPHESSESELAVDDKDLVIDDSKKDDDFEAEILLPHDLSEMEDDSLIELRPALDIPKQHLIPSRQQRLEVTTKPIDRPRSTTPINTAKLEAFIHTLSPTFVSKVEKIKLSLPGEQFIGRVKSPKKSSAKSWTDFCESGFQSPKMHKRSIKDDFCNPFEAFASSTVPLNAPFPDAGSNWTDFESNFSRVEPTCFSDNFNSSNALQPAAVQTTSICTDPYQSFETNFSDFNCFCICHSTNGLPTDNFLFTETSCNIYSCRTLCHSSNALNDGKIHVLDQSKDV